MNDYISVAYDGNSSGSIVSRRALQLMTVPSHEHSVGHSLSMMQIAAFRVRYSSDPIHAPSLTTATTATTTTTTTTQP